jgi:ApaG protein
MSTAISQGVKISVTTIFRKDLSDAENHEYYFNYVIEIENQNPFDVQLISRHWKIVDSMRPMRIVNGQGVIGEQPRLSPGEVYSYSSGCDLISDIGSMEGHYDFVQLDEAGRPKNTFKVRIPEFKLEFPPRLN